MVIYEEIKWKTEGNEEEKEVCNKRSRSRLMKCKIEKEKKEKKEVAEKEGKKQKNWIVEKKTEKYLRQGYEYALKIK